MGFFFSYLHSNRKGQVSSSEIRLSFQGSYFPCIISTIIWQASYVSSTCVSSLNPLICLINKYIILGVYNLILYSYARFLQTAFTRLFLLMLEVCGWTKTKWNLLINSLCVATLTSWSTSKEKWARCVLSFSHCFISNFEL